MKPSLHVPDADTARFTEDTLKRILPVRPELLTDEQRELAHAQHACRTVNGAEQACPALTLAGTSAQCRECLAHRLANAKPEKAA